MKRRLSESTFQGATVDSRKRREVAAAAAQLITEGGVTDYRVATEKAVRMLGYEGKSSFPDNHEVGIAVQERLALFHLPAQTLELRYLRESALELMRRLAQFSPLLRGPVHTGLANRFSSIELELIADDEKAVELFFLNNGVDYQLVTNKLERESPVILKYRFSFRNCPVLATVFMSAADRARSRKLSRNNEPPFDIKSLMAVLQQGQPCP